MLPHNNGNLQRRKMNSKKNAKLYKPKIEYTDDGFAVTTLYLRSLKKEIRRESLLQYFSQFGIVQNVRIHSKPTFSFGFVTFARAESAAKALKKCVHEIGGRLINVAVADSWHQEKPLELSNNHTDSATRKLKAVKISIELTNATGTCLLDLNDDCLYEIFSLKYVSLMDLCSVAESCTRLKNIAIRIFNAAHKSCNFNKLSLNTIYEMRRFLINFGPSIAELVIGPSYDFERKYDGMSVRVMDLVIKYCSKTLESLKLHDYDIVEHLTGKLRPMFNKLKKLHIEAGFFHGDARKLFSNCTSLIELKVIDLENDDEGMIFENEFPKLEQFKHGKEYYVDYENCNAELFVSRHQALKAFTMKGFGEDCSSLLPVIASSCKNLEKLQITGPSQEYSYEYQKALQSILTLTKLTKLKIKCEEANVTKFIQNLPQLPQLEFLELWDAECDAGFIPALSQLKNLNVLRLRCCKDLKNINSLANLENLNELSIVRRTPTDKIEIDIIAMIKRLVNLKKLAIGMDTFKIDKQMYLKMVNAVRERTGSSPSCLEFTTFNIEDDVADLQMDGKNNEVVKLETILPYTSDDEWSDDSDSDVDYLSDDYDDDDDDDDDDYGSNFNLPAAFLLPFLHHLRNVVDNNEDPDEEDTNEVENEVW